MNPSSGLRLYDANALQRWKSAALPADPEGALKAEAAAAAARADHLCEKLKLGGADDIAAVRSQAQHLKAGFLEVARTPERISQVNLKDSQLAYRAALAGLMVGALEGALVGAGQAVSAPIAIPDKDQWGSTELSSEVFTRPDEKVAKDLRETPLPPSTQKTIELLERGLQGGYARATKMCYVTHAEALQSSFEAGHSRVVRGLLLNASGPSVPPETLPRWTVLKYCISDTEMADSINQSVRPFAGSKVNPGMRVLVQHGGFGSAARFEVGDGVRVLETLPNTDMGKAATLQEFLEFGISQYPSEGYIVSILGHGTGPWGMMPDETTGSEMQVAEFGQALQNVSAKLGRKFDVVVSDNCLGGSADMAQQVAPAAHYWLSSEAPISGDKVILNSKKLNAISERMPLTREELVDTLGQFRGSEQRGVFNLDHYAAFESAFSQFSGAVRASSLSDAQIKEAGAGAVSAFLQEDGEEFRTPHQAIKDAGSLLTRFSRLEDEAVQKAAGEALEALKKMTVSNYVPEKIAREFSDLGGLSVLMPLPPQVGAAELPYQASGFAQDTGWLSTIQQRFPQP